MLRHQLSQDLVLLPDLLLEFLDPLLLLTPLRPTFAFQRKSSIKKQLLLPSVK